MSAIPFAMHEDWSEFFELSNDGIIIADEDGRIVYMNPAAEKLEEVSKDYILGKSAKDLQQEGIYETSVTVKVFNTGKKETVMQIKGGKQLAITGVPIFSDGHLKWVYINERDITELNKMYQSYKDVKKQLKHYKEELRRMKKDAEAHDYFITESPAMEKTMELLGRLAPMEVSVLIEGESGVGKDVHARWIHSHSKRADKPYMKIDCGVLSENLLESELFGYEKGAFTGANKEGKKGLVEAADGGTLFLDEIGELPLNLQTKLLRLLQEKSFISVGGIEEKCVDIRIIAATNKNLETMVSEKTFREDLYYRLNVVTVKLPPLRERKEDIIAFAHHFLKQYNKKHGYQKTILPTAMSDLCQYSWPGNVRELSNIIERLIVITPKAEIESEDVKKAIPGLVNYQLNNELTNKGYYDAFSTFEKKYLTYMIQQCGTILQLAEKTGLSDSTVKRKLKKYNLNIKKVKNDSIGQK